MKFKVLLDQPARIRSLVLALTAVAFVACGLPSEAPAPPATAVLRPAPAEAADPTHDPHWDYGEEAGPAAWGGLSPVFALCGEGRSQSPIDFEATPQAALSELSMQHLPASLRIVDHEHKADAINTGHSIQVNLPGADTLTVGTDSFSLLQFHFHSPSEHTIHGSHLPMEMHLVHRAEDGRLAVIGVMIEEGARNAAFDPIWENLPGERGVERHLEDFRVEIDQLLPTSRAAYRYDGSLTTPPCSEGVKWFVMESPIELSRGQIERFREVIMGNNRPVQPLNGRRVAVDAMQ